MNRAARTTLFVRRREVANDVGHQTCVGILTNSATAICQVDQAASCASSLRDLMFVALCHVATMRRDAPKYRFCATWGFVEEFGVSRSNIRGFGDFRTISGDRVFLVKTGCEATQVIARTGEAPKVALGMQTRRILKVAHVRNARLLLR
jgi:hypothetical protein